MGRSNGGPTLTVYKTILKIIYDEDDKTVLSSPFFLKMNGPVIPAGMYVPGTTKEAWDECVKRNKANFDRIGYKIYDDD